MSVCIYVCAIGSQGSKGGPRGPKQSPIVFEASHWSSSHTISSRPLIGPPSPPPTFFNCQKNKINKIKCFCFLDPTQFFYLPKKKIDRKKKKIWTSKKKDPTPKKNCRTPPKQKKILPKKINKKKHLTSQKNEINQITSQNCIGPTIRIGWEIQCLSGNFFLCFECTLKKKFFF